MSRTSTKSHGLTNISLFGRATFSLYGGIGSLCMSTESARDTKLFLKIESPGDSPADSPGVPVGLVTKYFIPSRTARPETTEVVVAIAGMIRPDILFTSRTSNEGIPYTLARIFDANATYSTCELVAESFSNSSSVRVTVGLSESCGGVRAWGTSLGAGTSAGHRHRVRHLVHRVCGISSSTCSLNTPCVMDQ
ncbi:hypothetical protein NEQG_00778 [Nematocida parisii ERTm3]|uniref:Uncharacterized protein n=1 Tax=Nematocida parisii (strain ERTm3) TaxID=935791 RepID=I3EIB2_NEMP3|nr:hypothetical protein NEQG_00778 [Nematocida parisii ERTm3]